MQSKMYRIDVVQLILVLESGFSVSDLLIDLLLHPGLQLRVVRQNRDQSQKTPSSGCQTW